MRPLGVQPGVGSLQRRRRPRSGLRNLACACRDGAERQGPADQHERRHTAMAASAPSSRAAQKAWKLGSPDACHACSRRGTSGPSASSASLGRTSRPRGSSLQVRDGHVPVPNPRPHGRRHPLPARPRSAPAHHGRRTRPPDAVHRGAVRPCFPARRGRGRPGRRRLLPPRPPAPRRPAFGAAAGRTSGSRSNAPGTEGTGCSRCVAALRLLRASASIALDSRPGPLRSLPTGAGRPLRRRGRHAGAGTQAQARRRRHAGAGTGCRHGAQDTGTPGGGNQGAEQDDGGIRRGRRSRSRHQP
jgi:hypothetical protein